MKSQPKKLGLEIDHDDTLAWQQSKPFALLVHGTQPKGTLMSKVWQKRKRENNMRKGVQ
jgi:hypothetical protein